MMCRERSQALGTAGRCIIPDRKAWFYGKDDNRKNEENNKE